MKTNKLGDWEKVVNEMEQGASFQEATKRAALLVRPRPVRKTKVVSSGQLTAITKGVNNGI